MTEHISEYRQYKYYVVFTSGGWRNGYVELPETHPLYKVYYDDLPCIECPGGITFSDFVNDKWTIGFDCNRHDEGIDVQAYKDYFGTDIPEYLKVVKRDQIPYKSISDIIDCCKHIIDQLILYENRGK